MLTDKQRRFVDEYLLDLNATQAAIRAGYSKKSAGQIGEQNLKKLEIAQAIEEAKAARSQRTEITQDMVLRELAKLGFSDIRKVVRWGSTELRVSGADDDTATEAHHGLVLVGADQIDDDTAAAIAEVSEGREGIKVKLHGKREALVAIGDHLGMFKKQVELTGKNGAPIEHKTVVVDEREVAAAVERLEGDY